MPQHKHTGTTDNAGDHSHTGTTTQNGRHTHDVPNETGTSGGDQVHFAIIDYTRPRHAGRAAGEHQHTLRINHSGNHNHNISLNNTGGNSSHENRPPYTGVLFLMWKGIN